MQHNIRTTGQLFSKISSAREYFSLSMASICLLSLIEREPEYIAYARIENVFIARHHSFIA